jgi:biopolymer transport protein ExbB/TolQ
VTRRLLAATVSGIAVAVIICLLWRAVRRSANTQVHRINQ